MARVVLIGANVIDRVSWQRIKTLSISESSRYRQWSIGYCFSCCVCCEIYYYLTVNLSQSLSSGYWCWSKLASCSCRYHFSFHRVSFGKSCLCCSSLV